MNHVAFGLFVATFLGLALGMNGSAAASGRVIASPGERAVLQSTPIVERPSRPLHFYGNTVRRIHYRRTGR